LGEEDLRPQRETLPIAGFALKANKFDGLYIGRRKGFSLMYAGKVDQASTKHPQQSCTHD
jgi:bifunctional non-homologous end joining protein LigD